MSVTFHVTTPNHDFPELLEVNVANGNARALLAEIAAPDAGGEDLVGRMPGAQFYRLVDIARTRLLVEGDPGTPSHSFDGPGATMIDCGRDAGYLLDRLESLRMLAEVARAFGTEVAWS